MTSNRNSRPTRWRSSGSSLVEDWSGAGWWRVRGGKPSRSCTLCSSSSPVRPCSTRAPVPTGVTRSRRDRPSPAPRVQSLLRVNCDDGTRRGRRTVGVFAQRLDLWLDNLIPDLRKLRSACRHRPSRIKSACAGRAGADRQTHAAAARPPRVRARGSAKGPLRQWSAAARHDRGMTVIRKAREAQKPVWGMDCERSFRAARACTVTRIGWVAAGGWSACAGSGRRGRRAGTASS